MKVKSKNDVGPGIVNSRYPISVGLAIPSNPFNLLNIGRVYITGPFVMQDGGATLPRASFIYMTDWSETSPYRDKRISVGSAVLSGPLIIISVGLAVPSKPFIIISVGLAVPSKPFIIIWVGLAVFRNQQSSQKGKK